MKSPCPGGLVFGALLVGAPSWRSGYRVAGSAGRDRGLACVDADGAQALGSGDVHAGALERVLERRDHGPTTTVCSGRQDTLTASPCEMDRSSRFCSSTVTSTSPHATRYVMVLPA